MTQEERLHLIDLCDDIAISGDIPEISNAAHWRMCAINFPPLTLMHNQCIEFAEEIECGITRGEYI